MGSPRIMMMVITVRLNIQDSLWAALTPRLILSNSLAPMCCPTKAERADPIFIHGIVAIASMRLAATTAAIVVAYILSINLVHVFLALAPQFPLYIVLIL